METRQIGHSTWEQRTEHGIEWLTDENTFTIRLDRDWFTFLRTEELIASKRLVWITRDELHRLKEIEWQYNQLCK